MLENNNATFDANLKYIEDEVEIRIETLKDELDKILNIFKIDLQIFKLDFIVIKVSFY